MGGTLGGQQDPRLAPQGAVSTLLPLPLAHAAACASAAARTCSRRTAPAPPPCRSCVLQCHAPKKEYYKKFLFEPLPGEAGGSAGVFRRRHRRCDGSVACCAVLLLLLTYVPACLPPPRPHRPS